MSTLTQVHHARQNAQLIVSHVSLVRGSTPVLYDVSLTVTPESRIAIVGENGRGKSTLLHMLGGLLAPDGGSVHRIGTLGLAEQEMEYAENQTVGSAVAVATAVPRAALAALDAAAEALAEEVPGSAESYATALEFAGAIDAWDAERRVHIALEALGAETDMTRPLAQLSVGHRYRVRLACLLGADDDFLLLDEPTNHLDSQGLEFLTHAIQTRNGAVVVVSHDRALLSDTAETTIDLDPTPDARPRVYGGGYEGYREGRVRERNRWEQEYESQEAERAKLQDSLSAAQNRLVSGWRPEKGTNKHGRATRAGSLVQHVHRRRQALEAHAVTVPEPPQQLRFPALSTRVGAVLLTAEAVSVVDRLPAPVSFSLGHRGRLVVTGPNGSGKTTLLRVLSGELSPDAGRVLKPGNLRVGVVRQESVLPLEQRASDVFEARVGVLVARGMVPESEVGLAGLGLLRSREANKRVGDLSVGQQRRLDLAIVLASRPHVLLLDEPTNHLSFGLVEELTVALGATEAAVVLSTHDRQLLRDVADWPRVRLGEATE